MSSRLLIVCALLQPGRGVGGVYREHSGQPGYGC